MGECGADRAFLTRKDFSRPHLLHFCTLHLSIHSLASKNTRGPPRMTPTTPTPEKKENLAWVDALRGIAILGVMTCHCFYDRMPWHMGGLNLGQWALNGRHGVQLFFVASAFTLARSWHRRKAENNPTRNYLIRRFFRIAPLYFLGILFYATFSLANISQWLPGWRYEAETDTAFNLSANLLFVHGWLPTSINSVVPGGWSIGVEMSFYLLVPVMASHLRRPMPILAAIAAAIPLAGLCIWMAHQMALTHWLSISKNGLEHWPVTHLSFLYFWLPTQLPVFLMGFFAYALLKNDGILTKLKKHTQLISAGLLTLCLLILWFMSLLGDGAPPAWLPRFLHPHHAWLSPSVAGVAACALLLSLSLHPWRFLVNRATIFLGKISYSLYLTHFVGVWVVTYWIHHHPLWEQSQPWGTLGTFVFGIIGCLAFSIPVAMLTHRFIETPGIALGKRLIQRLEIRAIPKN